MSYRCQACGAFNRVPEQRPEGEPTCGKCKETLDLSGAPQSVDADGLARAVASSPAPVVVDFWAPWCGPCHAVAPAVEKVAKERAGKVLVLKVNTEDAPAVSSAHAIRGIPTFVAFKGGAEVNRMSGALPADALAKWIDGATG